MIGFLLLCAVAVVFTAALAGFAYISGDREASLEDRDDEEPWTELLVRRHRKEKS